MNKKQKEDNVYFSNEEINLYLIFTQFSFCIIVLIISCYSTYGNNALIISSIVLILLLFFFPQFLFLLAISPFLVLGLLFLNIIQSILKFFK